MEQFGTAWKSDQIDMNGSRITESLPALVIHPLFKTDENPNNNDNRISTSSLASSSSYSLHSPLGDDKCSPVFLIVSQASCASLFDFIDFHGGHLPREIVPGLFKSLASAVHHMHSKGIVHGDIKEENILVGIMRSTKSSQDEVGCISRYGFPSAGSYFSDGDDKLLQSPHLTAKLCDFGHCKWLLMSRIIHPGLNHLTPHFYKALRAKRNNKTMVRYGTKDISAPELLHNLRLEESAQERPLSYHRYFGFEQDVWALGLLLYTMIHGELPAEINDYIDGEMKCRKNSHLPVDFDPTMERDCLDLLKRMLAIDPTRRISIQGVLDHPFVKRNRAR